MTTTRSKYIQIDDWCFEVKTVRALKVDKYGAPYKAIANCSINGDSLYVDGLLTKEDQDFTKEDYMAFYKFCKKLGIRSCHYDRFQQGDLVSKQVVINEETEHDLETSVVIQPIRMVK